MPRVEVNMGRLRRAMSRAPERLYKEVRTAWRNHHMRFGKRMAQERLSGRPGLKAPTGTLRRGLLAGAAQISGSDLRTLAVRTVFTGPHGHIAKFHEEGPTLTRNMPARLEFKKTWDRMRDELFKATNEAVGRALDGG